MNRILTPVTDASPDRRRFLSGRGKVVLSAATVALLAGCETMAAGSSNGMTAAGDVDILNIALGLEHEAIGAYQLGAASGLLSTGVLNVAVLFQSHHKAHRDALAGTIEQLGGSPVAPRSLSEYAAALKAETLSNETDVLRLAVGLEMGAANAYLGVIPAFSDGDLARIAGRLAADETMHWTALAGALGETLPANALSFGA